MKRWKPQWAGMGLIPMFAKGYVDYCIRVLDIPESDIRWITEATNRDVVKIILHNHRRVQITGEAMFQWLSQFRNKRARNTWQPTTERRYHVR